MLRFRPSLPLSKLGPKSFHRMQAKPLFSFGLVTDVQYADVDDAHNFDKTVLRHYRNSENILRNAVKEWNKRDLSFILQLGDLIDIKTYEKSYAEIKRMSGLFEGKKVYHIIGNHELYNLTREQLHEVLETSPGGCSYYTFSPHPGWRFIIVDSYDLNLMEKEKKDEALAFLSKRNPNNLTAHGVDWKTGLKGLNQRFLPYNGMIKQAQLDWFNQKLKEATAAHEKVVVLSHVPFVEGCSTQDTLVWNYEEIVSILQSHNCVVACLFGHDHAGGYTKFGNIHCRTFEAPLEAPLGKDAFCIIEVFENQIKIEGFGTIKSAVWDL